MVASGLDYLNRAATSGEVDESCYGEVLRSLQAAGARHAAARSAFLSLFDAAGCHDSDGFQNSSSWLRDKTGVTGPVARRQVKQMRSLRSRPWLAEAMAEGRLSESYADRIITWTKPLSADMLGTTDALILSVLEAGGDLDDVYLVVTAALESERAQRPDPGDPDDTFDDRSVRLETTMDGAGSLTGSLTPEAAAAVQAVLESLGKKRGKEDIRTEPQRHHDALLVACRLLIGAKMVPDRAGSDTRVDVHIPFSQLHGMDGASVLEEAWLRAKAGEHGWLLGKDAEVAACDALIVPLVTAAPEWPVITEMIFLVLDALGQHDTRADAGTGERPPPPLPPEEWQQLLYAMGKLAIKFVSGPGAIASVLRTGLLTAPFNTKSVPLDVGYSDHIPEPIRRAVIARDRGCAWPGCDMRPAACDVHHTRHKKDGGPTSVAMCGLLCQFHHDVCIHRWGWKLELKPDGAAVAYGPDGQIIRGHSPPVGRNA